MVDDWISAANWDDDKMGRDDGVWARTIVASGPMRAIATVEERMLMNCLFNYGEKTLEELVGMFLGAANEVGMLKRNAKMGWTRLTESNRTPMQGKVYEQA
jgi:hypothetical protein